MKKLFFSFVILLSISYDIFSSEGEQPEPLRFTLLNQNNSVNVLEEEALSIPLFKEQIDKQQRFFKLPGVNYDDLRHIAKYITFHQKIGKGEEEERRSLYKYANKLSGDALIRLTENMHQILNGAPIVLYGCLMKKELLLRSQGSSLLNNFPKCLSQAKEVIAQDIIHFDEDNATNKTLLTKLITQKKEQKSLITCLFEPYTQKLEQATKLPFLAQFCLLSRPIVKYIYVGDTITASLSGWTYSSCPHYNYTLTLHTETGSKEFKLHDKELDFEVHKAFVRKDESLFVCRYSNPYESGKEGILIVNPSRGSMDHLDCVGKTVACFGSKNELLSFDDQGKIFQLSIDAFGYVWKEKFDTKNSGIKGLISDYDNRLIVWDREKITLIKENNGEFSGNILPFGHYSNQDKMSISDVIVDCSGTKLCMKIFVRGSSSDASRWQYFFYDGYRCDQIAEFFTEEEPKASFSADGRLLIISSCLKGITTHKYFDLGCSLENGCFASWKKETKAELLAIGVGKSIEQKKGENSAYINTLIDSDMYAVLKMLNYEKFNPFVVHPVKIAQAFHQYFNREYSSINSYILEMPEIKNILSARHNNVLINQDYNISAFKSFIRFLYHNKIMVGGVGVLALIAAYVYKTVYQHA